MKSVVLFFSLLFLIATSVQAQEKKYSFEEQYNISVPANLKISSSDGDVQVYPGNEGTIKVFYQVYKGNTFMKISKEELEEHVILTIKHNDNLLDISVKSRNHNNWNNQYNVSFDIYTPTQTSCKLNSSDGDIVLSGLNSDQYCKTSDGDIRVMKVEGRIGLHTSDGDIDAIAINGSVDMETSDGDIYAETINGGDIIMETSDGDISIKDVSGGINASTSDGDIVANNCSGSMTASTSDGDIRGNFIKITDELSFITSDGDIDISVPKGIGLNLKLKGETLKTPMMDYSGRTDKHHIDGKVNGGGIPVELITSDGTITLSYQ